MTDPINDRIKHQLEIELQRVIDQRNSLYEQLTQYSGIRSQTKMLLISIYKKILKEADKLEYVKSARRAIPYKYSKTEKTPINKIEKNIAAYDLRAFRQNRVLGGKLRRSTAAFMILSTKLMAITLKKAVHMSIARRKPAKNEI